MIRRSKTLRVPSLAAAFKLFMHAPATGGYGINQGVVDAVMGARGSSAPDCPTFDAVREKYENKKACTFQQAFNACWNKKRDWREFDLRTLQDSHEEFRHLQLPERVYDALEREAIAGEHERETSAHVQDEEVDEAPPLELLHRAGSSRKTRRKCRGSKNACSRKKLAKKYRAAKVAYHAAGEQLRWAGIKGDLL
jgi:hypothetical protein